MARPREPWQIHPAKPCVPVPAPIKAEVEAKANDLIERVLKPKYVLRRQDGEQLNSITDIGAKWFRGYFYFVSTYTCSSPNALSTTFEAKFVRMEYLGSAEFALYAMRYTGKEWVGVLDALSVDECMQAIRDDPWFEP